MTLQGSLIRRGRAASRPPSGRTQLLTDAVERRELRRLLPWYALASAAVSAASAPVLLALGSGVEGPGGRAFTVDLLLSLCFLAVFAVARRGSVHHARLLFSILGWLGLAQSLVSSSLSGTVGAMGTWFIVLLPIAVALFARWPARHQLGWCAVGMAGLAGLALLLTAAGAAWEHSTGDIMVGFLISTAFSVAGAAVLWRARISAVRREARVRITRRAAEAASLEARASEQRYRSIVETAAEGIWVGDRHWRTVFVNDHFGRMVGVEPARAVGRPARDYVHPADLREVWDRMGTTASGPTTTGDFRLRGRDGIETWVTASVAPLTGAGGTRVGYLTMLTDVTERRAAEAQLQELNGILRRMVDHDGLTGLLNRRALDRALAETRADRPANVGVLLADVDHFKAFNDTHGHQAGDDALRVIGRVLAAGVRGTDRVYRYGGEEFLVLLHGASREVARSTAERLRASLAGAPTGDDVAWRMPTVSVGVAVGDAVDEAALARLVEAADRALYRAKAAGRDRVEVAKDVVPDGAAVAPDGADVAPDSALVASGGVDVAPEAVVSETGVGPRDIPTGGAGPDGLDQALVRSFAR
jgi:diguanylate cyclase (GGDEF)-like protein/PAS domain S-box-containing protein